MSRTIGILGVTLPGAIDCLRKIHQRAPNPPPLIFYQPPFDSIEEALEKADWPRVIKELVASLTALATMGADFAIIPCNTIHKVIKELQEESPIPVINLVEEVQKEGKRRGLKAMGVIGTLWTMAGGLYKGCTMPTAEQQDIIQRAIFDELLPQGFVSAKTLHALLEIIDSLEGDGLILGCTELQLVLNEANCGKAVIDTTEVLAKAALQYVD